jgi:hypothetical protein
MLKVSTAYPQLFLSALPQPIRMSAALTKNGLKLHMPTSVGFTVEACDL